MASTPASDPTDVPCPHCGQLNEKERDVCWACYGMMRGGPGPGAPPAERDFSLEFPGERRSAGVRPAGARSLVAGAYLWAIVLFVLTAGVYLVDWLIHRGLSVAYDGYLSRRFDGVQSLGDAILVMVLAGFTVKRRGTMGGDAQPIRRGDLVFAPLTCALAVILFIAAVLVTFGLVARRGPVME